MVDIPGHNVFSASNEFVNSLSHTISSVGQSTKVKGHDMVYIHYTPATCKCILFSGLIICTYNLHFGA